MLRKTRIILCLLPVLILGLQATCLAQKRKPLRKPQASKGKKAGPAKSGGDLFTWTEVMAGYQAVINKGAYFDYQRRYYFTENTSFVIKGDFPFQSSAVFGGSFHLGLPLRNQLFRFVTTGLSLSWSQRNFAHEIKFANTAFTHKNIISISEKYSASYLTPEFQVRFGSKVYGLAGIRMESLISGLKERSLKLEGESLASGKAIEMVDKWNIKGSKAVRQTNWGFHAGLGYSPLPYLGIRAGYLYSASFFTEEPDFDSHQYYFTLCFGLVK